MNKNILLVNVFVYQIVRGLEAAIPTLILVLSEPTANNQGRMQIYSLLLMASPVTQMVKNLPAMQESQV